MVVAGYLGSLGCMEPSYIEPLPGARAKLLWATVAGVCIGIALRLCLPRFLSFVGSLPYCEAVWWIRAFGLAVYFFFWWAGHGAARTAVRTLRSDQWPFPGATVWQRTQIRTGWSARRVGCVYALSAVIIFAAPLALVPLPDLFRLFAFQPACRG